MKPELNDINFIGESERRGKASDLFWTWAGANVSLLALSYGAFFLGFGISFWQATIAAVIGTAGSFAVVGISSLAGKRSNAPTMTLSRAAFGVKGNLLPGLLSYFVVVGWETVLVSLATLATGTVLERATSIDRDISLAIGFLIAASLTIFGGVLGHAVIMKLQRLITGITVAATLTYYTIMFNYIDIVTMSILGNSLIFIGIALYKQEKRDKMEFLAYKQIMQMNEELQNILMNLPEGIILINEQTNKVTLKNQEFMRIF
jgi:purine-cytosine permease-like protein